MSNENIDSTFPKEFVTEQGGFQLLHFPPHLTFGVLLWTVIIAHTSLKAADQHVVERNDTMIEIDTAARLNDFPAVSRQHGPAMVVAVNVEQWNVKERDQKFKVIKRQIAAGQNQFDVWKTLFGSNAV